MNHTAHNQTPRQGAAATLGYDVARIRAEFPILRETVRGKPLVYLDNAATTQKPRVVLARLARYYETENANIHRGVHYLSERATEAYEAARVTAQRFLGARAIEEIVFTRGTTEGINLVAQTYGRKHVGAGDEVLITNLEHHSNIVPWQLLCEEKQAHLRVVPITDDGELILEEFARLLGARTRIVALGHISNALGTINPVREMIALAHEHGAAVLIDGAQAAPHASIDVQDLDCDFYAFSGHKVYGPTGIGVLYGKESHLGAMPPYQGGGEMISSVTFAKTEYNRLPYKFEAGTPHIAGAIGLGAALDFVAEIGIARIRAHEEDLLEYGTRALLEVPGLRLIGTAAAKAAVLSFLLDGIHPHDAGLVLDQQGIAVRTGHHCAQPIMDRFGIPATVRASIGLYTTREEIDALVAGLQRVRKLFQTT